MSKRSLSVLIAQEGEGTRKQFFNGSAAVPHIETLENRGRSAKQLRSRGPATPDGAKRPPRSPNGVEETPPVATPGTKATQVKTPGTSRASGSASSRTSGGGSSGGKGTSPKTGRWTKREDDLLRGAMVEARGDAQNWKSISAETFKGLRSADQCLHRWQKVLKAGLRKGQWTEEEDEIVRREVAAYDGPIDLKWSTIAESLDGRLGKQVRERWQNHLDPNLRKEPWEEDEDQLLISLQAVMGNRWSEIARAFAGRSENSVKNRWNSKQRKNLAAERKLRTGSELGVLIRRRPVAGSNPGDAASDAASRGYGIGGVGGGSDGSGGGGANSSGDGGCDMTLLDAADIAANSCVLKIDFARALEAAKNGPRPEDRGVKVRGGDNGYEQTPCDVNASCAVRTNDQDVTDAGMLLLQILNKENH